MARVGNKWRITMIDGGSGKEYTKEVIIPGQSNAMLMALNEVTSDMAPNSIDKLTVEYLDTVDLPKEG